MGDGKKRGEEKRREGKEAYISWNSRVADSFSTICIPRRVREDGKDRSMHLKTDLIVMYSCIFISFLLLNIMNQRVDA